MRYAMIMAGGAGTRLWPMSRTQRPKQLLPLIADDAAPTARRPSNLPPLPSAASHASVPRAKASANASAPASRPRSLIEVAARRVDGLVPPERRYICTSESFRAAIRAVLPEFTDDRILGEPVGRDTVNAVGLAAAVFHKLDKNATFIVLTADHLIAPEDVFRKRAELAFALVEQDPKRLVTFSIKPTHAATGFGYVERGTPIQTSAASPLLDSSGKPIADASKLAYRVARFVEKPDAPRAQAYLESGHFAWNSGMFVFSAATFLDCLKRFKPESYEGLSTIAKAWGTKAQKQVLDKIYPTLPRISVDYAVMEPASTDKSVSVCTVVTDVDWLDVGSWPSYAQTLTPDADGNRTGVEGREGGVQSVLLDCRDCLVVGESTRPEAAHADPAQAHAPHTVTLLGCRDLIVVHTPDATLVMPRDKAEQLKKLHALVDERLK